MVGALRVRVSWRLLHIHSFLEDAMEEGTLDVQLVQRPLPRCNNSKDHVNSHVLNNRVECLQEINTELLVEILGHKTSLMAKD